ncbi:MAG: hypothetical protein JST28_07815 [Acidobacteria bacterium]|nr:hypothetical protein [Acidobacteriota bacterium]
MILCALADRRRLSAGLTYLFFLRGLVADLRAPDDFALDDFAEAAFFEVEAATFTFFFVLVDALEDLAFCAPMRLPSTGLIAIKAQSTAARILAGACVGKEETARCIVSMYDGFGVSERQRITTVTYPTISGSWSCPRNSPVSPPTDVYYT